jgi:nucleoside-diphosphate-sugar epimerase
MRIAVTGAAGYIGGWLMAELASRGHEIHAQDLVKPDGEVNWATYRTFDLCSQERVEWLRVINPEVTIHLAALYGRIWGEVDMVKTAGINAGLTGALARDVAAQGGRLMYVSSSEVYGRSADQGTVYSHSKLDPVNMYGLSKKWGEEAAAIYASDGLMITRLNMPYGPAKYPPPANVVTHTSGKPGALGYNVLHSMTWQAEHGHEIVVHEGTTRCLTWVGDTVRGLAMILESGQSGIWNVNRNDDHRQVADLAQLVLGTTGSTSKVNVEKPPPRVTLRKSLDNHELLTLGWEPTVELEEGVKMAWEYFRKFDRLGTWRGELRHRFTE